MRSAMAVLALCAASGVSAQRLSPPRAGVDVELEAQVAAARATQGVVSRQDMAGFGAGWSGGAQLVWQAPAVGARLRVPISTTAAGRYEVIVWFTRAPDYARFDVRVDGGPVVTLEGYAPSVLRDSALVGGVDLAAGSHELQVQVSGKAAASRGFLVGLDRLTLRAAPPRLPGVSAGASGPPGEGAKSNDGGDAPRLPAPASPKPPSPGLPSHPDVDCHGLKLKAASGIPNGQEHGYVFQGTCALLEVDPMRKSVVATQWTRVKASWNANTSEFKEDLETEGQYAGTVSMVLKCTKDPVFGGSPCAKVAFKNETRWAGFDRAWALGRPFSRDKTTLPEAMILSTYPQAPQGSNRPAPPPEPTPGAAGAAGGPGAPAAKTMTSPSGIWGVEGEQMIAGAQVTHGRIGRQEMPSYGPGWSGNAQLFWSVTVSGAQLQLQPTVTRAGRYEVFVVFTKAPDFGLFRASFDGKNSILVNGYAPAVSHDRALVGMFDLAAGPHELLLSVAGRDPKSTAFFVGIDRIEFKPVP